MKSLRTIVAGTALATGLATVLAGQAALADVDLVHDKGFWSDAFDAVTAAAQADAGVTIIQTPYSTAEQYKAFIQASIASGDVPDLFTWWTGATFGELVSSGAAANLNGLWDEMVASGQYDASASELFRVGGDAYAVPMLMARWVMIYNRDLFAQAGIEAEPTTWEELMAAADALKAAGITPFNATVHEGWRGFIWFQELMLRSDPEALVAINNGTMPYDSDAVRHAFEIWVDMYEKGYFTDARSTSEVEDFAAGSAGMYLIGEWAVGLIAANGLATDQIGAFITPNMSADLPSSVIIEAGPLLVSAAAAEDEEVMTAIRFWSSVEGANAWAEASGNYMGNLMAQAPNPIIAEISADMSAAGTTSYLRWWEAVPPDLQGELVAELNRFMLDPTMATAEDVMARMQSLNAEYWADHQ